MKQDKYIPIDLIQDYLAFLKNLSNEDMEKLEKNEISIKFDLSTSLKTGILRKSHKHLLPNEVLEITNYLYTIEDRDEGAKFLELKCNNRSELEDIIRSLDVPFQKKDSVEKLKDKIIERTIGFRLRSKAIQGNTIS